MFKNEYTIEFSGWRFAAILGFCIGIPIVLKLFGIINWPWWVVLIPSAGILLMYAGTWIFFRGFSMGLGKLFK